MKKGGHLIFGLVVLLLFSLSFFDSSEVVATHSKAVQTYASVFTGAFFHADEIIKKRPVNIQPHTTPSSTPTTSPGITSPVEVDKPKGSTPSSVPTTPLKVDTPKKKKVPTEIIRKPKVEVETKPEIVEPTKIVKQTTECTLRDARWSATDSTERSNVFLYVEGVGCAGRTVEIIIKENSFLFDKTVISFTTKFKQDDTATAEWKIILDPQEEEVDRKLYFLAKIEKTPRIGGITGFAPIDITENVFSDLFGDDSTNVLDVIFGEKQTTPTLDPPAAPAGSADIIVGREQIRSNFLTITTGEPTTNVPPPAFAPGLYANIGYGCTNAWYIDRDCDGYGIGGSSPRDEFPLDGQPDWVPPLGKDANDFDATLNTPATANARYGGGNNVMDTAGEFISWLQDLTCLDIDGDQVPCYTHTIDQLFFMDPVNGNDGTGQANNPARPFLSIGAINTRVGPGDVVILRGGYYYSDAVISWLGFNFHDPVSVRGSATQPVLYIAAPGEQVKIAHGYNAITINQNSGQPSLRYIIIDGFEINGDQLTNTERRSGIGLEKSASDLTFRNIEVTRFNAGIFGSVNQQFDDFLFDSVVVHDSQAGQRQPEHGIYLNPTASGQVNENMVIKDSIFYRRNRHGLQLRPSYDNLIITRNIFHSNALRGIEFKGQTQNSRISDNLFFNNGLLPLMINREGGHPNMGAIDNNQIYGNTIWVGRFGNGMGDSCWASNTPSGCTINTPGQDHAIAFVRTGGPSITFTNQQVINNMIYTNSGSMIRNDFLANMQTALIQNNFMFSSKTHPSIGGLDLAGMWTECLWVPPDNTHNYQATGPGWCNPPNNQRYGWSMNNFQNQGNRPGVSGNNLFMNGQAATQAELAKIFTDVRHSYNTAPGSFDFNPASTNILTDSSIIGYSSKRDIRGNLRDSFPDVGAYELTAVPPCTPGASRACPLQQGVCAGSQEICTSGGTWPGCTYGPNYESTENSCNDGLDNDCDGEKDWDTQGIRGPERGDNNCPVGITNVQAQSVACPSTNIPVSCTATVGNVNSVLVTIDGTPCPAGTWNGLEYNTQCMTTSTAPTVQGISCGIDLTKSYSSGTPEPALVDIFSAACASLSLVSSNPPSVAQNQLTTVSITGTNFEANAEVQIDGIAEPVANILAQTSTVIDWNYQPNSHSVGTHTMTIFNPTAGETSNGIPFDVTTPTTCTPGTTQLCPNQVGVCNGAFETCDATGNWPGCGTAEYTANNPNYNAGTESGFCRDGFDNDCDGEADFDGFTQGLISPPIHGDSNCAVSATAISLSTSNTCPGQSVTVDCTSTQPFLRSLQADIDGTLCSFIPNSWNGNTASFDCTASTTLASQTITCSIDTTQSYQFGGPQTAPLTVGGAGCCSQYGTQAICGGDPTCEWCTQCSGTQHSGAGDRCVAQGTCTYQCTVGACGAECDATLGGCGATQTCNLAICGCINVPPSASTVTPANVVQDIATPIAVDGTNFEANAEVHINGVPVPIANIVSQTPTRINWMYQPFAYTVGLHNLAVFNPTAAQTSNTLPFTVQAPSGGGTPSIISLSQSPITATQPTLITITGSNFEPAAELRLDGTPVNPAEITAQTATSIDWDYPGNVAMGSYALTVFNPLANEVSPPFNVNFVAAASTFAIIGEGCTTAWFIDKDCDGFGPGKQADDVYSNVVAPSQVGNIGDMADADDNDDQVWDQATAEAKYGTFDNINNLRTFLQARGYQATKDIFVVDPVSGSDLTGAANNINLPYRTWNEVKCEGCRSGGNPVCTQNVGGCKNQNFNPGDIVLFRGGNYVNMGLNTVTPLNNQVGGTLAEPVVFMAFPGETVVFDDNYGFGFAASNFIMDGIIVTCDQGDANCRAGFTSPDVGIQISGGARDIVIRNSEVAHFNRGIWPFNFPSRNLLIEDSVIHDQASEHGIYMSNIIGTATSGVTVRGNILHHNRRWGIQFNGFSDNPLIENNIIHSNGMGGWTLTNGVQNGVFQNNLVFNNNNDGFITYADQCGTCAPFSRGSSNNLFINNIVYLTGRWNGVCNSQWQPPCPGGASAGSGSFSGARSASDNPSPTSPRGHIHSGNDYVNNILVTWGRPAFSFRELRHLNSPGTLIENNVIYRQSGNPMGMVSDETDGTHTSSSGSDFFWTLNALQTHPTWSNFIRNNVEVTGSAQFNQMFEDVNRNYYLTPGDFDFDFLSGTSRGVNFATANQAPNYDLRRNSRSLPFDAGSYEFGSSAGCTPGATRPCPLSGNGVCVGAIETCSGAGTWPGCTYGPNYESTENSCNDGLDNDCDGEKDWDTLGIRGPEHGDDDCPVGVSAVTAPVQVCPGDQFTMTCTSSVGQVNSLLGNIGAVPCTPGTWSGSNLDFTCTASLTPAVYVAACNIDTGISYRGVVVEGQFVDVNNGACGTLSLTSATPSSTPINSLTSVNIVGTNFEANAEVHIDGVPEPAFTITGQTATGIDWDYQPNSHSVGTHTMTIFNPTAGETSNGIPFDVTGAVGGGSISSVTPGNTPQNVQTLVTVDGSAFEAAAEIHLNGVPINPVRYVSRTGTQIVWDYQAYDYSPATYSLTTFNPIAGVPSNGVPFTIDPPLSPLLTSIVPNTASTIAGATNVNLNGNNFDPDAELLLAGTVVYPSVWINSQLMQFDVIPGAAVGVYPMSIRNPTSGLEGNTEVFTVTECAAGETRLCPNQVGVCNGAVETCVGNIFVGCTSTEYQANAIGTFGVNYEAGVETLCDGQDNNCDASVDNIAPGTEPLCANQQGVCSGSRQTCSSGAWQACTAVEYAAHSANYNANEIALCADGFDNDCDGEYDYDGDGAGIIRGDNDCPVGITGAGMSPLNTCPGQSVTLSCTSTVANVNSITADLDGVLCSFNTWVGNTANFDCTASLVPTLQIGTCDIDLTKSYQTGSSLNVPLNVGGAGCCSGYGTSGACGGDPTCEWCTQCSGSQWSGGPDRCVAQGTCTYACGLGNCGAACDGTVGGCSPTESCDLGTCMCVAQPPDLFGSFPAFVNADTLTPIVTSGSNFEANAEVHLDGSAVTPFVVTLQGPTSIEWDFQPWSYLPASYSLTAYNPTSGLRSVASVPFTVDPGTTPRLDTLTPNVVSTTANTIVNADGDFFATSTGPGTPTAKVYLILPGPPPLPFHWTAGPTPYYAVINPQLTAILIPSGIPPGVYPVYIENPDLQVTSTIDLTITECAAGETRLCPVQSGVCSGAMETCTAGGTWPGCTTTDYQTNAISTFGVNYESGTETLCDGQDNNCDGSVDNIPLANTPLCPLQQGVCAGSVQACGGTFGWQVCNPSTYFLHSPFYAATENGLCSDGLDNDCDGEADRDGFTSGLISPVVHGDNDCPVDVIGAVVNPSNTCPGQSVTVSCTTNFGNVRSVIADLDGVSCTPLTWTGNVIDFDCTAGGVGSQTATCDIDLTKSYQSGGAQTDTLTVGGASCCSVHATAGVCSGDPSCEWCTTCSGSQWSGGPDRCVAQGTCTYACGVGNCGAACDAGVGGCSATQTCSLAACVCTNNVPVVISAIPSSVSESVQTPITVTGTDFEPTAEIRLSGSPVLASRILSRTGTTSINFDFQPFDFAPNLYTLTIFNPGSGISSVTSVPFTVTASAPTLLSLTPTTVASTTGGTVDASGTNFHSNALVLGNGVPWTGGHTFMHSALMEITVLPGTTPGAYDMKIRNPASGLETTEEQLIVTECAPGEQQACANQLGVCNGAMETCTGAGNWPGCTSAAYLANNPAYESGIETLCDGLDNNCDNSVDNIPPANTPLCANQIGACSGSLQSCGGASGWQSCGAGEYSINPAYAATESGLCVDGVDNDCDGEADYDGFTSGLISPIVHGDGDCTVGVTSIALNPSNTCPGQSVTVSCTTTVGNVRSITADLDGVSCTPLTWTGNVIDFDCTASGIPASQTATCSVDTTESYQNGVDQTDTLTVGGAGCCSQYGTSGTCGGDPTCEWCTTCSGSQYSGAGDRCVSTGTCTYACSQGNCGATCDGIVGGCGATQSCNLLACGCVNNIPSITLVNPPTVIENQGATVSVTGTDFEPNAEVRLDGTAVLGSRILSRTGTTSISWDYQPRDFLAGSYSLTVFNTVSGLASAGTLFTVDPPLPPVLTSIVPDTVSVTSATLGIAITGDLFDTDAEVYFDTVLCTSCTWQTPQLILADVTAGMLSVGVHPTKVRNPTSNTESATLPYTVTECAAGETRLCPNQLGVCSGTVETCTAGNTWPAGGCTTTDYQANALANFGVNHESGAETLCDGQDNNCDASVDNIAPGTEPLCANQQGVCSGSRQTCGGASGWLTCTSTEYLANNPAYNVDEVGFCADSLDNDCDGEYDYDGDGAGTIRGDNDCPVSISSVVLNPSNTCPGQSVIADCTANVGNIGSVVVDLDGIACSFISWTGNVASFDCTSGAIGSQTATCNVDLTKSYQSGGAQTDTLTVGGASCCSSFGTQLSCVGDPTCEWCTQCSGSQYSGGSDRCVAQGTCTYLCSQGQCGATCDGTVGGCSPTETCNLLACGCVANVPNILTVTPASVLTSSQRNITISGTNFETGALLEVDGTAVAPANILGRTLTTIDWAYQASSLTPGTHTLTVYNPVSTLRSSGVSFDVTAIAPPTLSSLTPTTVINSADETVILDGANFDPLAEVYVDNATWSAGFTYVNLTQMTMQVPSGTPAGVYLVKVRDPTTLLESIEMPFIVQQGSVASSGGSGSGGGGGGGGGGGQGPNSLVVTVDLDAQELHNVRLSRVGKMIIIYEEERYPARLTKLTNTAATLSFINIGYVYTSFAGLRHTVDLDGDNRDDARIVVNAISGGTTATLTIERISQQVLVQREEPTEVPIVQETEEIKPEVTVVKDDLLPWDTLIKLALIITVVGGALVYRYVILPRRHKPPGTRRHRYAPRRQPYRKEAYRQPYQRPPY